MPIPSCLTLPTRHDGGPVAAMARPLRALRRAAAARITAALSITAVTRPERQA